MFIKFLRMNLLILIKRRFNLIVVLVALFFMLMSSYPTLNAIESMNGISIINVITNYDISTLALVSLRLCQYIELATMLIAVYSTYTFYNDRLYISVGMLAKSGTIFSLSQSIMLLFVSMFMTLIEACLSASYGLIVAGTDAHFYVNPVEFVNIYVDVFLHVWFLSLMCAMVTYFFRKSVISYVLCLLLYLLRMPVVVVVNILTIPYSRFLSYCFDSIIDLGSMSERRVFSDREIDGALCIARVIEVILIISVTIINAIVASRKRDVSV